MKNWKDNVIYSEHFANSCPRDTAERMVANILRDYDLTSEILSELERQLPVNVVWLDSDEGAA